MSLINHDAARQHIKFICGETLATLQTFDDSEQKRRNLACIIHGLNDENLTALDNLNSRGAGVFFSLNQTDGQGRTAKNIVGEVRALVIDHDSQPVYRLDEKAHVVIETSEGKFHSYLKVSGIPLAQFTELQTALALAYNGDPAIKDLPRVMRVPGYFHQKGDPFQTRIISFNPSLKPYTLDEIKRIIADGPVKQAETLAKKEKATKYPEQITEKRNINLHKIACSLFAKGLSSEAVWVAIEKENKTKCAEPLPKTELMQLFKSAERSNKKDELEQVATQENFTDLGNAERLVRAYGHMIRYCPEFKKWLLWDGTRWVTDTPAGVKPLAYQTVRNMAIEAQELPDDRRTALIRHSLKSESKGALEAMISLAEAIPGVPVSQSHLDTNHDYLNAVNGTINLKTGLLRPHDPNDYITRRVSVEYNQFAKCPTWEKFINRIFDGNEETIKYVQKAVGYSLTGSTEEQCIFIPHGGGMNGKSKFLEAIEYILSDYASHCSADTLMVKHTQGGASSEIARLRGARFVAAVETDEGKRMSESLVKELTGGDTITARFLFSEHFEFIPTFKIWLACNHKPVIRGTDFAIWRRIKLIPFTVTIPKEEQDKKLGEKLRAEAAGILAWAVKGCMMWREEGLNDTAEIAEATAGYKLEMDSLGTWLDSMCVIVRGAESKASVLYENYKTWAEESGEYVQSMRGFGQKLGERGFQKINKNTGVHYIGLGLKADQDIKY